MGQGDIRGLKERKGLKHELFSEALRSKRREHQGRDKRGKTCDQLKSPGKDATQEDLQSAQFANTVTERVGGWGWGEGGVEDCIS